MTGWTLGKVRATLFDLEAHCQNESCRHFFSFDLDSLIGKAGPDFPLEDVPPLACPQCGEPLTIRLASRPPPDETDA